LSLTFDDLELIFSVNEYIFGIILIKIKQYKIKGAINFIIESGINKNLMVLNLMPKEIRLNKIKAKIKGIIICKKILEIVFSTVPRTGTNNSAINKEDVNTQIKVIGRYFMNSPANPGQKIKGKKAANVVAVDDIIGKAIFFEAML